MIETDIDFPHSLPCPLREGYDIQHVRPYIRTGMESGRARQRRRFTSVPSMVSVSWLLTESQAMAFEAWFRDSINDGTDWFNCPIRSPLGLKPYVCRFTDEMYSGPTLTGRNLWRFRAPLEVYERPLLPRGWGILPGLVAGMNIFDLAMNREWPELAVETDGVTLLTEDGFTLIAEASTPGEATKPIKISELPMASDLTGDEYIPLVQDGVTKKAKAVAVSDTPNPDADYLLYYNLSKD